MIFRNPCRMIEIIYSVSNWYKYSLELLHILFSYFKSLVFCNHLEIQWTLACVLLGIRLVCYVVVVIILMNKSKPQLNQHIISWLYMYMVIPLGPLFKDFQSHNLNQISI